MAAAASAHVTVHSPGAQEGGSATLTFKVPNEEADASTKQVEIDLPTDTPLTGVTAQAPAGWTSQVSADKIVFSGGTISGDDSVQFPVKVDKLPMSPTVVFKALQTYSDGNVVRWIEQAPAGAPEPAHPAPTLKLQPAAQAAAAPTAKASAAPTAKASAAPTAKASAAPTAKASAAPTAKATAASKAPAPNKAAAPSMVKAGTGGQASEGSSTVPVVPLTALGAGLGVAALAARRLVRR
jgi:uncharacterized protein YcnI